MPKEFLLEVKTKKGLFKKDENSKREKADYKRFFSIWSVLVLHNIITLGVNGIAYANETQFKAYYGKLITAIKDANPDTKIMLQSIFPVSEGYDQKGGKLCNANIDLANGWVKQIAAEQGCKYLDTASVLKDNNGCMIAAYDNGDGIHMTADAYKAVLQYIRTHGYTE